MPHRQRERREPVSAETDKRQATANLADSILKASEYPQEEALLPESPAAIRSG